MNRTLYTLACEHAETQPDEEHTSGVVRGNEDNRDHARENAEAMAETPCVCGGPLNVQEMP